MSLRVGTTVVMPHKNKLTNECDNANIFLLLHFGHVCYIYYRRILEKRSFNMVGSLCVCFLDLHANADLLFLLFLFFFFFSYFFFFDLATGPLTRYLETGCSESDQTWQSGRSP